MSVGSYSLLTLEEVMAALSLQNSDLYENAFTIYNSSADASAATVTVSGNVLTLVVTGGANAGTLTYSLTNASYDTFTELIAAINAAAKGWVANLQGHGSASSSELVNIAATGALLVANTLTLQYRDVWHLERMIDNVTDIIEGFCDRELLSRTHTLEMYDGPGRCHLVLKQYPVTRVRQLSIGTVTPIQVKCTTSGEKLAWVSVDTTNHLLRLTTNLAAEVTLDYTAAAYDTLTELVAGINAQTGWSATLNNADYGAWPCSQLVRLDASFCYTPTTAWLSVWDEPETEFLVNENTGILKTTSYIPRGFNNVACSYDAGYSTTPADLRDAALELVNRIWNESKTDQSLSMEQIGNYQYRTAQGDQLKQALSRRSWATLMRYMRLSKGRIGWAT